MTIGITNITNVSLENIQDMTNFTNVAELYIKINETIYGGWLIFTLLLVLLAILWKTSQDEDNQPIPNLIASGAVVSIISLVFRAVQVIILGVKTAMLTDTQMWLFPLVTIVLATGLWISKRD